MNLSKRTLSVILLLCALVALFALAAIAVFADGAGEGATDAMEAIESEFSAEKIGETQLIGDDGYIGIPVELSIYYDKSKGAIRSGYNGTPIIVYVVNTKAVRVGTDDDTDIIRSMLDRGYAVVILDYLNNGKAVSPALDWSVQGLRIKIRDKAYFSDSIFPSGVYYDNYVVPAGCDISLNNVFFEADKHGADGTLEKIVENWNNDFRGTKGERLVKWVRPDGSRKVTLDKASDGTSVTWYTESGKVDAGGEYTKVKYTVAETITDCVNPDGTPIDLNQYIHIVYPTNPAKPVPVMTIANSAGYLASSVQSADRPQMNGFLFNGYAGAMFDYLYVPMARDDSYGYYDGNPKNVAGAISGDQITYSVHVYNNGKVDTAAMRYIRYLALSDPDTYSFDIEHFGVYGNSKAGWMNLLGEARLQVGLVSDPERYATVDELEEAINDAITAIIDHRALDNHHGETRYDNGITESYTKDGVTIDGGERQPWLTYNGKEIISGVQLDYPSNGPMMIYFNEGHCATFEAAHLYDGGYGAANNYVNAARNMDIPCLFFEVPLGHTFTYGADVNYGVDTYSALFDFAAYHLKGEATRVMHTDYRSGAVIDIDAPIKVMFTGQVSQEEIAKITLTDSENNVIDGSWSSAFGGLEWTFHPNGMKGSTAYTLTVPKGLCGENGVPTKSEYTASFYTYYGEEASISSLAGEAGDYIYFTAPNLPSGANGFTVRFRVTENAANVAQLYALTGFDAANASAATVGELIGSVNLKGAGYYEIDVTEYVAQRAGEEVAFLLRGAKSAGESEIYSTDFSASFGVCKKGADATVTLGTAPDGTNALKAVMNDTGEKYINHTFYTNPTSAITLTNPFGLNITEADYGRAFTVKTRIYDTVSRTVMFNMNYNTSASRQILDYQYVMFNCTTRAGEWTDVEFTYVVYDTDYGKTGPKTKNIGISVENTGDLEKEIYFADFTVTETVTDVNADSFTLMARNDGGIDYSAPVSDKPFAIYSGTQMLAEYSGWAQALSAYRAGERIVLRSNYTFTDSDIYSGFSAGESFDIDLGGYKIICKNTKNSLIWIKNTSANDTVINISGGEIKLKDTALISYESSTAAGAGKSVSVVLSDVTVCAADNAMMKEVISASTVTSGVTTYASVTLNDCDIVLDDEKMSKEPRILFPDGAGDLTVSYKVNGGRISITSQRRFTTHENCKSVEYGKGKDGEYTAVTMHSYAEVDETVAFLRGDTVASLVAASTENNITTYAIAETELSTRYGMIPKQYADETDYPFVVFDGGGNFLGATAIYSRDGGGGALNFINSNTADEWYVLLRRNYIYNESVFNNVSFINGSVTVDLGGFTFSCQQSGGAWLDSHAKRPGVLNYTVKNGTVEVGTMPLIRFSAAASGTAYDGSEPKTFNYVFDGIKFTNIKAATLGKGGYPSVLVNANVTMRNCELDLTEVPTDFVMFTIPETAENLCSDIRIEGGAFISSDDLSGIKINTALNSLSSVKATKNSDGEYSKAILPAGAPAPTVNISSDEGNMCFKLTSTDGVRDTYTMIKNPLETKYGVIPSEYADVDAYPFVLFDENGNCLGATASLMGHSGDTNPATVIAIKYLVDKNVFDYDKQEYVGAVSTVNILLRRDYTYAEGEVMDNLAFTQGTVTIDLNDFTLYQSKYELFRSCAKGCSWSGDSKIFHTTFILKNGNIVLKNNHFAVLSAWDNTGDGKVVKKDWTYSFEDVNFSFAEGATAKALFGFDANAKIGSTFFLNFEGCIFDFDKVAPTAGFTLFSSSSNLIKAVYTVEGGEILASSMNNITVASLNSNGTLLALRDADGKYLMLKTSGVAPTVEFDTADECKAVFAATDTAGEYVLTSYEHSYDNACDAECNVCGKERTAPHTPGEDDGSCLTEVLCSACGATAIPARDAHTPGEDDGNCMTAIGCTECDSIAVPAKSAHSFGDVDWDKVSEAACQEAGCNVVSTKYGVIPSEYADVDAYPFVLFDENGNCLGATASLMGHSGDTNPA
ncbi:MAG: hypothetical protein IKD45_00325, partial [Clostridia bacterium]|nr:hypothetical protein [Clostridia bacterium]